MLKRSSCLLLLATLVAPRLGAETTVDFAREVLPILSNKCFVCHGPDTRKKDLVRLDSFEGATRDLGGYRAIDPESLEESELLKRIHDTEDPTQTPGFVGEKVSSFR